MVLPPTSALERDHYDLVFQTFAVRNTARFTPAVLPKADGARHDWEIFRELATRVQSRLKDRASLATRLALKARLSLSPTASLAMLLRLHRRGTLMSDLRTHPQGVDLGPLEPQLPGRLATKDHRVHAAPDLVLGDLARLRTRADELTGDDAYDGLLLIGRRHQRDNNSWMHNSARLTKGRPGTSSSCTRTTWLPARSRTAPACGSPRASARSRWRCAPPTR